MRETRSTYTFWRLSSGLSVSDKVLELLQNGHCARTIHFERAGGEGEDSSALEARVSRLRERAG